MVMRMKKDAFNGYIKDERIPEIWFLLIFVPVVMIGIAALMLVIATKYNNFGAGAREAIFLLGCFSMLFGIAYPISTLFFVRNYPKHKRICHLLLKSYMFSGIEY